MSIFNMLFGGNKTKTAVVAKERLQIILARERGSNSSNSDYLSALQKELVAVISKYVKVNPEDIKVSLEKQDQYEVLEVNIMLPDSSSEHNHTATTQSL